MRVKRASKQDLAKAWHPKYLKANKMGKGKLLDEFVEVSGYHRNYAKPLLLHGPATTTGRVDRGTATRRHAGGQVVVRLCTDRLSYKLSV